MTNKHYHWISEGHGFSGKQKEPDSGGGMTAEESRIKKQIADNISNYRHKINLIPFGTLEYWKQRAIHLEKSNDPTYSKTERDNCFHCWLMLVNKTP